MIKMKNDYICFYDTDNNELRIYCEGDENYMNSEIPLAVFDLSELTDVERGKTSKWDVDPIDYSDKTLGFYLC